MKHLLLLLLPLMLIVSCDQPDKKESESTGELPASVASLPAAEGFRTGVNGKETGLYILSYPNGIQAAITNYGGRLVSLLVPDNEGKLVDVVLGFNSVTEFVESGEAFFGATIGRFGNRIGKGQFSLNGKSYQLPINNEPNTLHGGPDGFHNVVFDARRTDERTLVLSYLSPDGEMGFPGTLSVTVTYSITDEGYLQIDFDAETDQPTVVNLTNHAFFNLNGEGSGTINDHLLMIPASTYTPVDETLIPMEGVAEVVGTPFDFTHETAIGSRVGTENEQLRFGSGYDHNFILDAGKTDDLHFGAMAIGDQSGIYMEIWTTEPGMQFYGGNFLKGEQIGKAGKAYDFRTAFCLEPQHFPDSPNRSDFPSTVLNPGDKYHTVSQYRFSAE